MGKKLLLGIMSCVVVLFFLPLASVLFVSEDAGMIICLILFYVVNPLFSIGNGIFSGRSARELWSLPGLTAIIFLLSTGLLFEKDEMAFLLYAGIYLGIGYVTMLITYLIGNRKES